MFKGTLSQVLTEIAKQLSFNPKQLIQYAQEAPHAQARPDGNPWPSGTGSVNEKRILYAIAKALRADEQLDLGTRWGAFATQLLTGNPYSTTITWTVDKESHIGTTKHRVGKFIPDGIIYHQHHGDCVDFLNNQSENTYGVIFEDTAHNQETTYKIYKHAERTLTPGGIIISHDAAQPKFKGAVVAGIIQAGIEPSVYLVEGDGCGLAIWQKPKRKIIESTEYVFEGLDNEIKPGWAKEGVTGVVLESDPPPKPKRKRRKSTKRKKPIAIEDIMDD